MSNDILKELFDYENFFQKEIFVKNNNPWELISNLSEYLDTVLKNGDKLVGDMSHIDASAEVEGKLIMGKNSTIADNVLIRGDCIIGDNVHIGHAVEIKHSIIMDNTAIAHLNYVGDSIIGNNVNIGGGAIIANWRFDKKNIKIKFEDKKIDTNLEKFGACVGDFSSLGINSALNPGTILGKRSLVYPLVSAFGVHRENSVLRG